MLNRIRQSKSESTGLKAAGFTIIEVMIVLAIAGIIMAIVFLAIPAIQRSNRNTQRKSDASRLGGLVAEYSGNNNGTLPANVAAALNTPTWAYFATASVTLNAAPATVPTAPTSDQMVLITAWTCGATPTAAPVAGTARQSAVWYGVEPSGTQCLSQ